MKLIIDTETRKLYQEAEGQGKWFELYSKEAFALISQQWLKIGWKLKYSYTFSWMGRPVIQLPEDIIRVQEVIHRVKPDVIIETGIAHGGSLILYASLCKMMGNGRVIGIDIETRPQNRKAIQAHELFPLITLVEGNSTDPDVIDRVQSFVKPWETVMVVLDSRHDKEHVLAELESYHYLVTPGSYIVATDGIMKDLYDVPRGEPKWARDNPAEAAAAFAEKHPEFVLEQPAWPFNESPLTENTTYWQGAWLRKIS